MLRFCLAVLMAAAAMNLASAQTDFFWSDKNLGQGVVNEPMFLSGEVGDQLTLYLYYTTNGPSDQEINVGLFLDIESDPGLAFTSAETLNPDITVNGTPFLKRWRDEFNAFGATGDVTYNRVAGLASFSLPEDFRGLIDPIGPFVDEGYDEEADAYLVAQVTMTIAAEGCFGIRTCSGRGKILNVPNENQEDVQVVRPTFGCASVCTPLASPLGGGADRGSCSVDQVLLGDVNRDGILDLLDVGPFVDVLTSGTYQLEADVNEDSVVDLLDINGFINLLLGGGCVEADPNVQVAGDANCSGCTDLSDLVDMFFVLFDAGVACDQDAVDLNNDGAIDLLDLPLMIELVLQEN